jgi:hypothetical protein
MKDLSQTPATNLTNNLETTSKPSKRTLISSSKPLD